MSVLITPAPFDPYAELRLLERGGNAGALASFVGYCRDEAGAVQTLELEHYPGFTERTIVDFAQHLALRHSVLAWRVVHRVGRVAPGNPIVLAAAVSRHRAEAFAMTEALMDFLKTDAPFWKAEHRSSGSRWIEPTQQDYQRRETRS